MVKEWDGVMGGSGFESPCGKNNKKKNIYLSKKTYTSQLNLYDDYILYNPN